MSSLNQYRDSPNRNCTSLCLHSVVKELIRQIGDKGESKFMVLGGMTLFGRQEIPDSSVILANNREQHKLEIFVFSGMMSDRYRKSVVNGWLTSAMHATVSYFRARAQSKLNCAHTGKRQADRQASNKPKLPLVPAFELPPSFSAAHNHLQLISKTWSTHYQPTVTFPLILVPPQNFPNYGRQLLMPAMSKS